LRDVESGCLLLLGLVIATAAIVILVAILL